MSRAGHMLQDYGGLPRQIFAQMMGDDLCSDLETAAFGADQHRDRFAFVKIALSPNRRNPNCEPAETNNPFQSSTMVHEPPLVVKLLAVIPMRKPPQSYRLQVA
jgi:hypothetical protein